MAKNIVQTRIHELECSHPGLGGPDRNAMAMAQLIAEGHDGDYLFNQLMELRYQQKETQPPSQTADKPLNPVRDRINDLKRKDLKGFDIDNAVLSAVQELVAEGHDPTELLQQVIDL